MYVFLDSLRNNSAVQFIYKIAKGNEQMGLVGSHLFNFVHVDVDLEQSSIPT